MSKIKIDNSDKGIFFVSKNPNKNIVGGINTVDGTINIIDVPLDRDDIVRALSGDLGIIPKIK